MGQYIYVGKFNGNNNFLHFSRLTAYRKNSGSFLIMCHMFE